MYSVVLMMALSGSAEATDCHRCHGCSAVNYGCSGSARCHGRRHHCCGCTGYVSYGCTGAVVGPSYPGYPGPGYPGPGYPGPGYPGPGMTPVPGKEKEKEKIAPPMKGASIKVNLPADAVLTIDGQPTTNTSAERLFTTPPLDPMGVFSYSVRVEFVENGQRRVETQVVPVRAGQESRVRFGAAAVTQAASR